MTASAAERTHVAGTRQPLFIGIIYGLTVIATTGIIGGTVLVAARDVLLTNEREYLRASARTASAIVDGDLLATITRPEQESSKEYAAAVRPLSALDSADNSIVHAGTAVVRGDSMYVLLKWVPAFESPSPKTEPSAA